MRLDRLDHLRFDPKHRIEGHHRILKDHRDTAAAHFLHFCCWKRFEVCTLEEDLATDNAARRVDKAQNGKAGYGFARTGFTHQPHDFASTNLKTHPVNRLENAAFGEEMGL